MDQNVSRISATKTPLLGALFSVSLGRNKKQGVGPKDRAWRLLEEGVTASKDGDHARAYQNFAQACLADPSNRVALETAGFAANRAMDWDAAHEYWRRLSELTPERSGPKRQSLAALVNARRWTDAGALAEALAESDPTDKTLRVKQIEIALLQGEIAQCRRLAVDIYEQNQDPAFAARLMKLFVNHRLSADAARWADEVERLQGDGPALQIVRARLRYLERDYHGAAASLKAIAKGQTDSKVLSRVYVLLGRVYAAQGLEADAEAAYADTLKHDPENAEALGFVVDRYVSQKRIEDARRLIAGANIAPESTDGALWEARILRAAGDQEGAVAHLRQAYADCPENHTVLMTLLEFLLDTGHCAEGRRTAVAARETFRDNSDLEEMLFRIVVAEERPVDERLQQAERALELNPRNATLLNGLGTQLVIADRRNDAAEHYVRAVEIAPQAAMLWRNGAYHLRMIDQLDRAGAFAEAAEAHFSRESPEELAELAAIYNAAGRKADAMLCIDQALEIKPDSMRANEVGSELSIDAGDYSSAATRLGVFGNDEKRIAKTSMRAAKCQAAFRTVGGVDAKGRSAAVDGLFPERLFEQALAMSAPDESPDRELIVHVTGSLASGGAERQVTYTMQGLYNHPKVKGKTALIIDHLDSQRSKDFYLPDVKSCGYDYVELEALRAKGDARDFLIEYPQYRDHLRLIYAMPPEITRYALPLFCQLVRMRPRVVHCWQDMTNMAGGLAAVLAGVPKVILSTRNTRPINQRRLRRYMAYAYRKLMEYPGMVVVNNSRQGGEDYEKWLGLEPNTIHTLYNGYNFDTIGERADPKRAAELREQLGIPANAKVLGGAMRFAVIKRPDLWTDVIFELIKRHDDVYGVLCGDGPMRDAMLQKVKDAGLEKRVHLVGRQFPIEPWMKMFDMFYLSSSTEGLPNVLIESQYIGTPVATMDAGGSSEAMGDGYSGVILHEERDEKGERLPDAVEIADKIEAILMNDETLEQYAANSPEFVRSRFSQEAMVERTLSFY